MLRDPEVIDVRPEEQLDTVALEAYLRAHLPGAEGDFGMWQFGGGHANLTFLVRFDEREFVLRRPPLGPLPARAHDMQREYRVLSRLYDAFPLAPKALLLCTDRAVIGSDFVIEERRHGIAIRRGLPERYCDDPALAQRIGDMLVDTLADLHRVNVSAIGLDTLGKPEGFVARQLASWIDRWHVAQTHGTLDAAHLTAWLSERLPPSPVATIVHNDYKLDNMLVDADDPSRVTALLDWDMCTVGDPLMDVGYMLALWPQADEPSAWRIGTMPTWRPGFRTRAEAVARYAARTGFDITHIEWYRIFSLFRFAGILQQIYKRYVTGQTHDERFASFGFQANAIVLAATGRTKQHVSS